MPAAGHPAQTPPSRKSGLRGRLAAIVVACLAAGALAHLPLEGAPPARGRGARFLESVFRAKPETPPAFIPLPQPPGEDDVERLAAEARKAGPPDAAAGKRSKPAATAANLPSWRDATGFASAAGSAARKILTDAADVDYRPKPAPPPATVTVSPSASGRQTLPLVVTRLQPTGMPAPRTPRFERLRRQIDQTLKIYQRRPLNTAEHTPWEVMHGFIAFGIPTQVRVGGPAGDLVSAIGWSNMGGKCRGQTMLSTSDGRLVALKGYFGVQGHSAQYLAILAQCRVAASSPISVDGRKFTVADLIEEEKLACKPATELTFSLIALAHYLPTDATWTSRDGEKWSLARLVEEEIVQPIRGAPCGGTHRLFGLAYGCQRRLRLTGQLDGVYLRADRYVRDFQNFTLSKLQNRDGSFSTEWFKYAADREDDVDRKIQTTGQILEWLVSSLDQERLYEPRVVAAAEFLCRTLSQEPSREWKIGPPGHALHALNTYQERAWGVVLPGGIAAYHGPMKAAEQPPVMAEKPDAEEPARR
ncbi:MAG: hypothetical protein ACKOCX_01920 [Planctomycetota bacterium]